MTPQHGKFTRRFGGEEEGKVERKTEKKERKSENKLSKFLEIMISNLH
jgi:hypothetical protein